MKTTCYVSTMLNMNGVLSKTPESILDGLLSKYGRGDIPDGDYDKILSSMKEQVEARFLYDYHAIFDFDTGKMSFMISFDDYKFGEPWVLKSKKGHVRGLYHSKNGHGLSEITKQCEKICRDYILIALSYSATGEAAYICHQEEAN